MKKLIFIHGPNGVGKSTACALLHKKLTSSAWLESEWCRHINPFTFTPEIELLTEKNITFLLRSYLECSLVEYVIFNWGFHGPRKRIFEKVLQNLSDISYDFTPITVTCSLEENLKRMKNDGRSEERILRAIEVRAMYGGLNYPVIDTTDKSVEKTVDGILEIISSSERGGTLKNIFGEE